MARIGGQHSGAAVMAVSAHQFRYGRGLATFGRRAPASLSLF